jgi:hypothetical protein
MGKGLKMAWKMAGADGSKCDLSPFSAIFFAKRKKNRYFFHMTK